MIKKLDLPANPADKSSFFVNDIMLCGSELYGLCLGENLVEK